MKRQTIALILALVFCLGFAVPALAADNVSVLVNGNRIDEQKYNPVWNNQYNQILVKPAFFADYFAAEVSFENGVTTIAKNSHTISVTEAETRLVMDGIGGRNLTSANLVLDGEGYIPLRYACESLGAQVDWTNNAAAVGVADLSLPDEIAPYLKGVTVFDQSSIRLSGSKVIYVDPYRIAGEPQDADIILVTHTHADHMDLDSIKRVMKDSTVLLIAGEGGAERAGESGIDAIITAMPDSEHTVDGIKIKAIPAYNTSPERQNHKPEHNFVGYIVELDGVTYYAAGDTDYIDDMNDLEVDVAFLPIDGRFNMDEVEAARAANAIAPKVAVPYHFNNFSSEAKARDFNSLLDEKVTGIILTFKMYGN